MRDNLLRGAEEAAISELTLGARQSRQNEELRRELGGVLPEEMRACFDISIVLGESRYDRGEILRKNNLNHKMLVIPEETKESAEQEGDLKEEAQEMQNMETAAEANASVRTETAPVEETKEAGETEKRRRHSYPLRARINIPYEQLSSIRVIHGDGSFTDIMRQETFVLIGTDQMNMMHTSH